MDDKKGLISAYKRYGFILARDGGKENFLVFTLKNGYFDNAEIIKLSASADTREAFQEFSSAGFACTVREAKSPATAEQELFNGFFSVDSTRSRLTDDYNKFTSSLVKPYGEKARYKYINAPYQVDGKDGQKSPPEEVLSRLDEEKPILFLIEAAAGFGKTCTAQEISRLINSKSDKLPLYAELSRNRQARIFRYILLDEIDRTFPLLNSGLVQSEIKNGRIAVILDGFDELLRKSEETGDFENKEPMLETIGELLTGRAKVVITTRRTVLFDGDQFHQWLERHAGEFALVRMRIQEPRVNDWLPYDRIENICQAGIDLDAMVNPVLLSYLRCIDQELFSKVVNDPEAIVQSYFEYMFEREMERQDLRMTPQVQSEVLKGIALDMMAKGYTAEHREYIVKTLLEIRSSQIDLSRNQYAAGERPSREEIANKLASHALLDRSSSESKKIGFVNEFSLGNFVAENIISDPEWLGDDLRFIDPAVRSYAPRTKTSRELLFNGLTQSLPYFDARSRLDVSANLVGKLPDGLINDSVEVLELSAISIGNPAIESFQFCEVVFKKCTFITSGLNNV